MHVAPPGTDSFRAGRLIVASGVARLSQVVSQVCRKSPEVGGRAIDQPIRGALRQEHPLLDQGAQVALQRSSVNARTLDREVLNLELTLSKREFERDALPSRQFVLLR